MLKFELPSTKFSLGSTDFNSTIYGFKMPISEQFPIFHHWHIWSSIAFNFKRNTSILIFLGLKSILSQINMEHIYQRYGIFPIFDAKFEKFILGSMRPSFQLNHFHSKMYSIWNILAKFERINRTFNLISTMMLFS